MILPFFRSGRRDNFHESLRREVRRGFQDLVAREKICAADRLMRSDDTLDESVFQYVISVQGGVSSPGNHKPAAVGDCQDVQLFPAENVREVLGQEIPIAIDHRSADECAKRSKTCDAVDFRDLIPVDFPCRIQIRYRFRLCTSDDLIRNDSHSDVDGYTGRNEDGYGKGENELRLYGLHNQMS